MKKRIITAALGLAVSAWIMIPVMAESADTHQTEEDGQNPVMNYVGRYGLDRCTIDVSADGNTDAMVTVSWASSAVERNEWNMSGPFDPETLTITYDNATEKTDVFNEDGEVETETVVYENGKGSFTFEDISDGTILTWNDEEEHVADDSVFVNYSDYDDGDVVSFASSTDLEDGILTIRISPEAAGGDFSWSYLDAEGSKVELLTDTTEEDGYAYVGSFRGTADGDDSIRLVFGNGVYVQQYMDFDVIIKDGKITDNPSGSAMLPTLHDDLAAILEGTWAEEDGNRFMTMMLDAADGFDVIVSDGGGRDGKTQMYAFTAYYDAINEGLIYRDGTVIEAAITSGDETEEESAEKTGDGNGIITIEFTGEGEDDITLLWQDSDSDMVRFVKES